MDDTSGLIAASPLFTSKDASGVEADKPAPVTTLNNGSTDNEGKKPTEGAPRDFRFWAIIASLCVTGLLGALENTVVTTSLPTIVRDLNLGDNYIWITNVFFLTSAAVQPFFGQLANIFGRRWLTLSIVALFTLGSGICGGATNGGMLIAGRAIQGMGSGGINMIVDVIVSDMVPLRERGNYMAVVLSIYFIGTSMGPFVGGAIVDSTTWRWVFYVNLPVGGLAMVMLFIFLHLNTQKEMTFRQKMARVDYGGNTIIIGSTVSVLFALTYGGTRYSWTSGQVLAPLIIGLLGLIAFVIYENAPFVIEPVTPPRLFNNRTSLVVFAATFLYSILLYWVMFFLPVYFQAVLGSSPPRSGVQLLPIITIAVPAAILAVVLLTKWGRYKPIHLFGFAICTIGLGLFTLFDENSSDAEWIIFQIITGGGSGVVLNTLLPACQAPLLESDQAATTAIWSFVRSFGNVWGVAIPAAIFNNRFSKLSDRIDDPDARAVLSRGHAYAYASRDFVNSYPEPVRGEIISVYRDSLKLVWQISIVFSGVAFFLVLLEKQIKLRTELDTEFGLADRTKEKSVEVGEMKEGVKGEEA